MNYKILRLKFSTAVHFGSGRLGSSDFVFQADRLFSAMCIEAKRMYGAEGISRLYKLAGERQLVLSDAMPYIADTLYIPKPIMHIESNNSGSSSEKKAFKRLSFIPADKLEIYLDGCLEAEKEADKLAELGKKSTRYFAKINENDDAEPYRAGVYEFEKDSGLYFIVGFETDETYAFAEELLIALQYEGIGGERSSGLGKFDVYKAKIPTDMEKRLTGSYDRYMTLSAAMAKDSELSVTVEGADYSLIKRSGFVSSYDYSDRFVKKRNFYAFGAGSCFGSRFEGAVFDVGGGGSHPVYRYAVPMLMGVK